MICSLNINLCFIKEKKGGKKKSDTDGARVPERDSLVGRAGDQRVRVGQEGDAVHRLRVAAQRAAAPQAETQPTG